MAYTKLAKGSKPKIKPLWNLYEHGLTQGAINTFLECREQFRLKYVEGWYKKKLSDAIEFGLCFHDCLATVQTDPSITVQSAISKYQAKRIKENQLTGGDIQKFECLLGQCEITLEEYQKHNKFDHLREWLAREKTFCVKYTDIPLRGRWDGLFYLQEGKKKVLRLHETKTKAIIDEEGIKGTLPFDTQTMLYMLACKLEYGVTPGGVIYDVIRRPGLRQGVKESLTDFLARTRKDIQDRPKWYFLRWQVDITEKCLAEWESLFFRPVLNQITDWATATAAQLDGKHPLNWMNPNQLFSKYGKCDLFDLITKRSTFGLSRKKVPFPELEG